MGSSATPLGFLVIGETGITSEFRGRVRAALRNMGGRSASEEGKVDIVVTCISGKTKGGL